MEFKKGTKRRKHITTLDTDFTLGNMFRYFVLDIPNDRIEKKYFQ